MKQKMYLRIAAIAMVGLMISCSTSNEVASNRGIQKRKYTKGYFFDFNKKLGGLDKADQIAQNDNKEIAPITEDKVVREVMQKEVNTVVSIDEKADFAEIATTSIDESVAQDKFVAATEKSQIASANQEAFEEMAKGDLKNVKSDVKFMKKQFRHKKHAVQSSNSSDDAVLYYILCFFIPWLAVGLVTNWDMHDVLINLLLTLLCGIPGIIHAIIVVSRNV